MARKRARKPGPEQAKEWSIDRKTVKRYVRVASVVLPSVMPLVYQGAAAVRDRWDQERAKRLGVSPERLGEFTGKGAALHARIARLTDALTELRSRHPDQAEFAETSQRRLADLAASVRAAEQMPASRRRAAHRSVVAELDRVEHELLRYYQLS